MEEWRCPWGCPVADCAHRKKLEARSMIGRKIWFKEKGETERSEMGVVTDEVYIIVGDYKHMIQRVRRDVPYWDGCNYAYRTGYYTFDASGQKLKWGQFTQFLTEEQYRALLAQAREKGWPLFSDPAE
jgi:hypothetical protein